MISTRKILAHCLALAVIGLSSSCQQKTKKVETPSQNTGERWSETRINAWYDEQDWLVGANFAPSSAINQLEMWQADTFDPQLIDQELAWARDLGFNTMRVFLHDLLWEQDAQGLIKRVETYLDIAESHSINTMLVLLDDVWNPYPQLGKQPEPKPHVHNSGWVQSPGHEVLVDSTQHKKLEDYVKGVMTHFKDDKRVLIWDLYNEPGNGNGNSYGEQEPENKSVHSLKLLKKVYAWAREVNPSQPISIDVWTSINKTLDQMSDIDKFAYENSDVINFHCYANAEATAKMVERLAESNRPLFCTEYMARSVSSTFQEILPIFKKHKVAAYNWGFVSGKSQTIYPWDSWQKEYTDEPDLWFHDIFRTDGTPYKTEEVEFIKSIVKETAQEQGGSMEFQVDANLEDWGKYNYLFGLSDPWVLKGKDQTHFDFTATPEHFYFYFKTIDHTPTEVDYVNERSLLWADRVELFFSADKELSEYYGAEMTPDKQVLDFKASFPRNIDHGWDFETLTLATKKLDDGYIVEGSISRKELESFGITNEFYFGVFRADFHGGRKVNWYAKTIPDTPKADFHVPSAFAKTYLND
ncbi:glycoside hydrolase family 2 TIM barrel-domain containing protein [Flagellimonas myxillae]|uniref:glycoside hydrolase family 2 TIM barrel-domain containing protein n=1 Tax=Flagellimonas myxillae TaxID=2942214 RepID=UPI00201F8BDF|nr:glycoside hydrolase family 2 TIM barrel-domain containing protein [Muricauda myxillae]MCL6265739.1 cellulase family glycosylhydrolase [Muricauda myxillae]